MQFIYAMVTCSKTVYVLYKNIVQYIMNSVLCHDIFTT